MVNPGKALGRALIGSLFIYGGRNALVNRQHLTGLIDNAQEQYGVKEKVPATSEQLIQANGAGNIVGGRFLYKFPTPSVTAITIDLTVERSIIVFRDTKPRLVQMQMQASRLRQY